MANTTQAVETPVTEESSVSEVIQETVQIAEQVGEYGSLIISSLSLILGGMLMIYILHRLASKLLYPYLENRRLIKVVFGTLYVLILVVVILMALKAVGFQVTIIAKISILIVLIGAVIVFFLVPFFPRLPFKIGHMIEINGVLGIVDNISTYHTTIRKLDGTMAFIPNALVMATKILNYHDLPERRIEINLSISIDSDLHAAKALILRTMNEEERVLETPALPRAFIVNATRSGAEIKAFCWVANADWLTVRSDLWMSILDAVAGDNRLTMSLPQQQIHLVENN